ncbi:MAG TPA: GWxTD domain-containing protein [Caldithrix abyssi]|uniref:GWxTD domain-containing protein n=1 Tax=Caldithrix abyssi TaxID=187145 RepID=A0A7V4WX68_CALAY|nr:GWxTD domain-containing protein [Caldithrix abyssi]
MPVKIIIKIIFILLVFIIRNLFAQYYEKAPQSGIGSPYFELIVQNQFDETNYGHKLLILAQFLYDDIDFIKSDTSGYDGEIELLLAVYDENNRAVSNTTLDKKINVKDFKLTNSRDEQFIMQAQLSVPSGEYTLLARSTDLHSNKSIQRKIQLHLQEYKDSRLKLGAIMFLKDVVVDSANTIVEMDPTFGNNFTLRKGYFYINYSLYCKEVPAKVSITYKMEDEEEEIAWDTTVVVQVDSKVSSHLFRIDRSKLKRNKYRLIVVAQMDDFSTETSKFFSFYWSEVPYTDEDIDKALRQMTYILEEDTLEKYLEASLPEKQAFFKRFWAARDPDPSTAVNELKNEYYKRVNFANRNFSAMGLEGWLTDRGRILIKFGFPDDIERHPFDMNSKPYVVWRYYSLRKVFVFVDRTGFGDYQLHPDYLDMEYR